MKVEHIIISLITSFFAFATLFIKLYFASKKEKTKNFQKLFKKIDTIESDNKKLKKAFSIYVENNGVNKTTKNIVKKILKENTNI